MTSKYLVTALASGFESRQVYRRPYFPDLLHQPNLLISPRPGEMIAVFVYDHRNGISWTSAFNAAEDVCEVKLRIGEWVVAVGISLSDGGRPTLDGRPYEFCSAAFDQFYPVGEWNTDSILRDIRGSILHLAPKRELRELWNAEREREMAGPELIFNRASLTLVSKYQPSQRSREATKESLIRLAENFDVDLYASPRAVGLHGLRGAQPYNFDLALSARPPIMIDILRTGKYPPRARLHALATKARIMRWSFIDGHLSSVQPDFQPVAIIDGNISGPDHDPFRYLRNLLGVGWRLVSAENLPGIMEFIIDEDV